MDSLSGTEIRKLREAKGWSQSELAHYASLGGQSVISNIERGLPCSPATQYRIHEALGLLRDGAHTPIHVVATNAGAPA